MFAVNRMPTYVLEGLLILAGILIGAVIAWLYGSQRRQIAVTRVEAKMNAELAVALEKGSRIPELQQRLSERELRIEQLQKAHADFQARVASLEMQISEEREAATEKLALLNDAQARLSDAFKALSSDALRANNQSFIEMAGMKLAELHEAAKGDMEKRQMAIGEIVKPVRESLEKVDAKIGEIEKSRASAYSALVEQLQSLTLANAALQTETTKLSTALSTTRTAGTWGELQLRRVVELAGMVEHCDFSEQETGGGQRPDLVVRLPHGQRIVVDAKAPTDAYREAASASEASVRAARLREHAAKVRGHVEALSSRAYWEQFQPSPEFVVLFLPGDQFLSAALEAEPALIDRAIRSRVLLATPSTLIALLKAAAYGWRQAAVSQNAEEISKLGRELYDRIATLTEHFDRVRKSLDGAVGAYNDAVGALERSVLPGARKFGELGAGGAKEIRDLEPIDEPLRSVAAAELRSRRG
jgi:DNA recombination protein RmuC